ncbi:MAG: fibronectin type III domain-containing protein, partial [Bacteroidia bacterium]|nr:fibronectin type III domain-containing protein [Bacteroidia bacterium]
VPPIVLSPQFPAFSVSNVELTQPTAGQCNGRIRLILDGGTPPFTATVNAQAVPGAFQSQEVNITGQCGGTKTVCVRDANGCTVCEQLLLDCGISVSVASVVPSCAGQTTGRVTVSATGGVAPLRYSIDGVNFQTSPVFTGLAAGSYTITILDAAQCDETIGVNIPSSPAPNVQIAQIDPDQNQSNGQIWVDVFGGTAPIRIRLRNAAGAVVSEQTTTSFQFTGLAGGCYSVEVQDGAGCIYPQQVCLAQPCTLTVNATSNGTSFCAGEVIELFAQANEPGVTYRWTGLGIVGPNNQQSAAAVHFTNPCSNQGSCLLGYEVEVRNPDGCIARDTVIVRFVPAVTVTPLGPVEYVQGAVINTILTASAPGNAQVQWFRNNVAIPGANSPTYTATEVGCYTAGININGQFFACNTGAVCITADIIAGVQADTIFYCDGDLCVQVTAEGPAGTQYYWTPPGGLSSQYGQTVCIRPRRTTTYSVTMTDANGNLIAVDEFVVVRRQRPVVSVVPQGALQFCQGAHVDLVALYNPNYYYTWLRNGQPVQEGSGQANATYRATQTGAYVLRVTDMVTGCSREGLAIPVNANPAPFDFNVTPASTFICPGQSATFTASVVVPGNPNPSVVFTWTLPNGSTFVGAQLTTNVPGTYSVTAQVAGFECVPTRIVTLQASNLAVAQTNFTICNGQSVTLTASGANTYTWTNFVTGEAVGSGASITVSPSSNITYAVTTECGQTATVSVQVLPFNFNPPSDVYLCANNPFNVTLALSPPFPQIVQWFLGNTQVATGTSIQVNPSVTTTYRVVGSNLNGCTAEALVTVFVADQDLVIDFDGNPATLNDDYELICAEEFYQFDPIIRNSSGQVISAGLNYRWDWIEGDSDFTPAQQFSRDPRIQVFRTTTFTLTVTGAGCQVARTVTLETLPAIEAIATGPSGVVCSGGGAQLNVVFLDGSNPNAYAYEWIPSQGLNNPFVPSPIANPTQTTIYTVVITDPNTGCQINREVTVSVSPTPVVANISGPSVVNRCTGETFNFETPDAGPGAQYFWYVNNVLAEGPPFSSRFFNWNQGGLYRVEVIAGDCQASAEKIVLNNDIAVAPTNFAYDCPTNLISWVESQSGLVEQIEWLPAGSPSNFIWNVLQVDISESFQGGLTQYYLPLPPGFYRLRIRSRCGGAVSEYVTLNNVYICGPCEDAGEIVLSPNPDGTSITISWNAVANAAGYRYQLGTVSGDEYNWFGDEIFTTQTSAVLSGLTPGINYAVRVRTQCDAGATNFSQYIEAEFNLSQQLCQAPALTVVTNSCTSAQLSWTAVSGAANYRVEIINNATGAVQTVEPVTTNTFTATGLVENTSYTFRVRTICASGFISSFTTAQAVTPPCPQPCFPVTGIRFRNVTENGVTVEWTPPTDNANVIGYTVEVRRTGTFALVAGPVSTTSTSVTLPLPGTVDNEYVAVVRTNCQGGGSAEATEFLKAQRCYFPGTADFDVETPTPTRIVVTWDAPSNFVFYILRLLDESGVQLYSSNYVSAFNESYTFPNVQPGRTYVLYVTVVCEFNEIVIDDIFAQAIQMPAPCASPQSPLTVFAISTGGFTAAWTPAVANPDVEILPGGYRIEVRETNGGALVHSQSVPGSGSSSAEVSGLNLTPGVSYTVLVYGDCGTTLSNPISTTFTVPLVVCGTPTIVSFDANAERFSVSWTAGAGNITGYRVDIDGFDGTVISESFPATVTQVVDYVFDVPLTTGTYTLSVTAICDNGDLFSSPAIRSFVITGPPCTPPSNVVA